MSADVTAHAVVHFTCVKFVVHRLYLSKSAEERKRKEEVKPCQRCQGNESCVSNLEVSGQFQCEPQCDPELNANAKVQT